MAMISVTVSTENESSIKRTPGKFQGCVMIELQTNIRSCGSDYPYARDTVSIHGSAPDIRRFAEAILADLPEDMPDESEESYEASAALMNPAPGVSIRSDVL